MLIVLVIKCASGSYSVGDGKCLKCDKGFYQPYEGGKRCHKCPDGKTTVVIGPLSEADCNPNIGRSHFWIFQNSKIL